MKDNRRFQVDKIISCAIKDARTGETLSEWKTVCCPLFEFCNCKTAMCRVAEPDESCYWYRYFKKLSEEKKRKI